ncbi:hypothetical protein GNX18_14235 [Microbulbifer sp. SH-1]|uniref:hypothetical protein n=1 Tax=Microbulbifer sp. SH-1 TaxID=2681547 RepID=UPI001409225C|nr:hypothetical protein [Microbulbifer sp. SH-1]QIL90799.1 hypothetical protein GNX18_14235 [Microbulbifer sp. SH-1]
MRTPTLRKLALAGLLSIGFTAQSHAQGGFWGGDDVTPSLVVAATQIEIDVPMPVSAGNLELMLAQAGNGGALSDLKQQAIRTYTQHLHSELATELHEYLDDEKVPLVQADGALTLQNNLNLKVIKHLAGIKPKADYDLEQGNVTLNGEFRYVLSNRSGTALREQRINIDELRISEKYLARVYHDGRTGDDNTEEAIKKALSELVEQLVESMEENLEADRLRELAAL